MQTFNELTLKALLLDTITYLNTGQHLAPNWKQAKHRLCEMSGQKLTIKSNQLLHLIGTVYQDNGLIHKFWATIDKYDASKHLE